MQSGQVTLLKQLLGMVIALVLSAINLALVYFLFRALSLSPSIGELSSQKTYAFSDISWVLAGTYLNIAMYWYALNRSIQVQLPGTSRKVSIYMFSRPWQKPASIWEALGFAAIKVFMPLLFMIIVSMAHK